MAAAFAAGFPNACKQRVCRLIYSDGRSALSRARSAERDSVDSCRLFRRNHQPAAPACTGIKRAIALTNGTAGTLLPVID